jgi:hypothetical protein
VIVLDQYLSQIANKMILNVYTIESVTLALKRLVASSL